MNELLFKLAIKNHDDVKNPQVREAYGKLAGIVGVISNIILCAIKVIAGILSSSISIIADGINNLSDATSSIITLVGFKLSALPEDEDHPYGHARSEYLAGLIVSIIIIFVGFSLGKSSISKILHPQTLAFTYVTISILVVSIVIKIWQAFFNYKAGTKIDSTTLKATATDSRNDVIATSMVLLSVVITKFTGINLDGYLGVLVALFIIWSGIGLIKETASPLLGEAPDEELVKQIEEMALSTEGVLGIHDLVVHNYGPSKIFATMHIEVDAAVDCLVSHDMVDNIEKNISTNLGIHFVAHMDPVKLDDPVISQVKGPISKCLLQYKGIHTIHDMRCVPGQTHTNIIFDVVVDHDCIISQSEIIDTVNRVVKEINPNYYVVITFDKAYTNL